MSDLSLQAPAVQRDEGAASQVNVLINGLVSRLMVLMGQSYRTLTSHRHSPMTSLPSELVRGIISHLTMAELIRFRGVCRFFHEVFHYSEKILVR